MAKNLFSKIIFSLILLFCLFSPATSFAQSPTPDLSQNILFQKQKAIKNNTGLETWTHEAMTDNMVSLFIGLNGTVPEDVFRELNMTSYLPGGAIGQVNEYISSLQTPPASGIEYIAQVKNSFLGKPAYAQGVGFQGLQFLLPVWRAFRNVVYVLTSIIFIAIGIMIMLRVKISPQAVITVQSAIPRIITSLILVTFSYAIAGLVIDLCNLIQAVGVALLFSIKGVGLNGQLFENQTWFNNIFQVASDWIKQQFGVTPPDFGFSSLSNPDSKILNVLMRRMAPKFITGIVLGGMIGKMIGGLVGETLGGLTGALIPLLLSIVIFFWLIKLLFGMIKCYAIIIFKVILAPLEIGMGSIPNSKINFSSWFTDIISNALVFPIITIVLVLSNVIMDLLLKGAQTAGQLWVPSVLNGVSFYPDLPPGRAYIALIQAFGVAVLAITSKLPDMIPVMVKEMKGPDFGKAIGESLGKNIVTGFGGQVSQGVQRKFQENVGREYGNYVSGPIGDRVTGAVRKLGFGKRKSTTEKSSDDEGWVDYTDNTKNKKTKFSF